MEKWKSLFIPIFVSLHSFETFKQDIIHTFINCWRIQFSQVTNIYFLVYIQDNITDIMYKHNIKAIVQSMCNSCPLLEECSIEIKFTDTVIMSYGLRSKYIYHIIEFFSHFHVSKLQHKHIHFRFILQTNMFRWLYQYNYLQYIHNSFAMFSDHTYSYALDFTTYNFHDIFTKILSCDYHKTIRHISIDWGNTVHQHSDNTIQSSIIQIVKKYGFMPYQFWHFYRDEKQYCSRYLDNCYYMFSYFGIKFNKGRKKTISWRQGKKHSGQSIISSAMGVYTNSLKWKKVDVWEELALRCINSRYGIVYIPHYLYDILGKIEMQSFKKREKFQTCNDENIFPYHKKNDYINNGEFWIY